MGQRCGDRIDARHLLVVRQALDPSEPVGPLPVGRLRLGSLGDRRHRAHDRCRVVSDRRLAGQHHRVRAVEDRVRHIAHLGTCGRRRRDHRLEHLGGGDHRNAGLDAVPDDAFLEVRDVLDRAVDAEVATSDHHDVGGGDDLVQMVDRRTGLHLRDDLGSIADHGSNLVDVAGRPHERHGDELDSGSSNRFREHEIVRRR